LSTVFKGSTTSPGGPESLANGLQGLYNITWRP